MNRTAPAPITPPPRLLLFDLDDTLCDYASARAQRLRIAFSLHRGDLAAGGGEPGVGMPERDAEWTLERMIADSVAIHPHGADHFPEVFRRYGLADPDVAEAAMAWYRTNRFHGLALFADAAATIAALRRRRGSSGEAIERRIGLVTNGPADVQRDKIALLGVNALVDFVVVSGEFGAWKPDPRIFAEALRLGGAEAAEAVFIGDSPEHDMAGAAAAGIRSIWVNRTGQPWSGGGRPPDYEVTDLTALLPLLGADAEPSAAASGLPNPGDRDTA